MKRRNVLFSIFGISLLTAVLLAGCSNLADALKNAVISFNESRITCNLASGAGAEVKSGTSIAENTALYFTAKPSAGNMVSSWRVNGEVKATTQNFLYYANPKELKIKEGQTITVTFDEVEAKPVILKLAENVIAYKGVKDSKGNWYQSKATIANGTAVKVGDYVWFVAKLTDKHIVDRWVINGKNVENAYSGTLKYKITLDKAMEDKDKNKVIEVSVTKMLGKVTVTYNDTLVTAKKMGTAYRSGTEFEVGDELTFTAQLPDSGVVSKWKINDVAVQEIRDIKKAKDMNTFNYKVDPSDVKGEGKSINISFEWRDVSKVTISYDDKAIACYAGTVYIPKDTGVEVGITLTLKNLLDGTVDKWFADTREVTSSYKVELDQEETLDGAVVISCVLKDTVTVTVDADEILRTDAADKAYKVGDEVRLTAKVSYGKKLAGWYKDGRLLVAYTYPGIPYDYKVPTDFGIPENTIDYKITADDAKKGKITLSCKLHSPVKLKFDTASIKVYEDPAYTKAITPEKAETLAEGTKVYLEAVISDPTKVVVKAWKVNGIVNSSMTESTHIYTIRNANAVNGVIEITCELEAAKKIKVHYDSTKIECVRWSDSTAVESDKELNINSWNEQTLDRLIFKAKGDDASKDVVWFVNGVKQSEDNTWNVYLKLSWTQGKDGVANVYYQVK